MDVIFAFIDETYNTRIEPPLSSCTALLVGAEHYDPLRIGFYRVIGQEVQPEPKRVTTPPELHWREFLPHATDERKLEILEGLIDLVFNSDASLCRVSYFVTDAMKARFLGDPRLHALTFFGLQLSLGSFTRDRLLVPVVDAGFVPSFQKTVQSYSGRHRVIEVLRSAGIDPGINSLKFANHGEVLYGDSEFSAPLQLVDVLSGIRSLVDTRRVEPDHRLTDFKEQVLAVARELDVLMLFDRIVAMELDGQVQGPVEFKRRALS